MDKSKAQIQKMFSDIAGYYDIANSVLSLGLHSLWKKKLVKLAVKSKPAIVLDLCCGTGDIHLALLKKNIKSIALDFTFPMLKILNKRQSVNETTKNSLTICGDALNLPFNDNSISCVTVAYGVRNFESLHNGLMEIHRVLETNGKLIILESGKAPEGITGSLIKFYESRFIPLVGKFLFSNLKAYSYLSQSSEEFLSRQDFIDSCLKAGFRNGRFLTLCAGASYIYEIDK